MGSLYSKVRNELDNLEYSKAELFELKNAFCTVGNYELSERIKSILASLRETEINIISIIENDTSEKLKREKAIIAETLKSLADKDD